MARSPSTHRILINYSNIFFLFIYFLALLIFCFRRQHITSSTQRHWDFQIISASCAGAGIAYFTFFIWALINPDRFANRKQINFVFSAVTWTAITFSLHIHPTNFIQATSLVWWFSFSLLVSVYNLEVLLRGGSIGTLEILDLVSWPVNCLHIYCTLKLCAERYLNCRLLKDSLDQPLLAKEDSKKIVNRKFGFFSYCTFSWLNPLLRLEYSRPLQLRDIPPLDSEDRASQAYQKFIRVWDEQCRKKSKGSNSVPLALAKCHLKDILVTAFLSLLRTVAISASPVLLYAFFQYSYHDEKDLKMGLVLVGCLVLMKLAECLSQRFSLFESRKLGMRMRSALMADIFRKQLKLAVRGRKKHSAGEIVNYIAIDAYRLGEFPVWFHISWSGSLQLLFALGIIFWAVGLGALPGLVTLAIFSALNVPFAKTLQGYVSKLMVAQDERLRATSEALNNMKNIKLQSWEEQFRTMIENLRNVEFHWLSGIQFTKAYVSSLYWLTPTVVSAVIFSGTAWLESAALNASTVFTVLTSLRIMSEPMKMLPEALSYIIQTKVSLDRIGVFLLEDEIDETDVKRCPREDSMLSIQVVDGSSSWESDESAQTLRNINLSVGKGSKVAICGPVGSGKSSLLYAVLGELPKCSGSVEVYGRIAYVSQTSWIQSGTVRENILYGWPMNKELYEKAIKSCALDKDISHFDHGDLTEIGQRGLNMSGGQKQRIQLARAVYSDADIYLLDDPFSAVDAHTAATLFHDCVMGALKAKTVVLVTHQIEFLNEVDRILVMENGEVTQEGTYDELLKTGTAFKQLVNAHTSSLSTITSRNEELQSQSESIDWLTKTQQSEQEISTEGLSVQLTEDEETEIGDLGLKPYKDYFLVSDGYILLSLVVLAQFAFLFFQILSTYWMAIAIRLPHIASALLVGVYTGSSIISCFFTCLRSLLTAHIGLKASKAFSTSFMNSVFKAPMLFFDSTPVGRILTRASSDLSLLDLDIPFSIGSVVCVGIEWMVVLTITASITWQVLIIAVPITIIIIYVQKYYMASARELVRINGTTKAPVMNYSSETVLGAVTIRAFGTADRFFSTNLDLIDNDAALFYYTIGTLEWVLLRVEMLQNMILFASCVLLVFPMQGVVSPEMLGFALSYALNLSAIQVFWTRTWSYLENYIISVERIKQFMQIPPEPPAVISGKRPPAAWPSVGEIDLQELKIKYRLSAPLVLKGITCTFAGGSKVGVVGRTGSGKTTLISALFRLLDPTSGRILIYTIDICSIGLKDLRMKLSIIPQEPTLFRGSIRKNIDPLGRHTDQEIWEALEKCQLKSTVSSLPELLDSSVSDEGQNWSVGQRQLFCLGRVLLRKNKILVLDEATASVDSTTDAILQRIIRQEFLKCTVLTIAHRVPTVTDSDMVLVLSYGELLEYDKPSKLLASNTSAFAKLVAEYWSNYKRN